MLRCGRRGAAAAGAVWFLWAGPLLAVGTVQVDGAGSLSAEEVRKAAGIEVGIPLLRVDVDAVEARVAGCRRSPLVEVTRGWPRSVVITVVERVPVAVVGEAGRRSLVDADGVLFDTITGAAPPAWCRSTSPTRAPGTPPPWPRWRAGRPAREVREEVDGATVTGPEDITLTLTDGTLVRWAARRSRPRRPPC